VSPGSDARIMAGVEIDRGAGRRYIARQPIFDRRGAVHGYELLFRAGMETSFRGDGELATRAILDSSVLFGVAGLTGGPPAFVNCTLEVLAGRMVEVLPPGKTVLELLETLKPTLELVRACQRLKALGYRIALDDFEWTEGINQLLELADYIKVDFIKSDASERRWLRGLFGEYPAILLAEKVETQEEYEQARREGFALFQGYYFCRPALLSKKDLPANKLAHMEILRELNEEPMDLHRLSRSVERDAAISYRLLRLVNSPACAVRREVRSVESALIAVGEQTFRSIATLAIASAMNAGQSAEVLRMAFVRARFCELAAQSTKHNPTEQYLLGLFSMLPSMLGIDMAEAIECLGVRREIREALLGTANRERALLGWIESSERGDWSRCDAIAEFAMPRAGFEQWAVEALVWADEALHFAS
jgi:c-di-GMP-related signal transduction protein